MPNRQIAGNSTQGNPSITNTIPNYDDDLQDSDRMNVEAVTHQNYQSNFPKISSNLDRITNRNVVNKSDPPLAIDNLTKKDQP